MSDISAGDAGNVTDVPAETVTEEAFDLDAAVEEFATSAPDDWKPKAAKIQSELKGLRSKYTPYRDAFDGIHADDQAAVFQLVTALKSGDMDSASSWMLQGAKALMGDKFTDAVAGLTPAQQEEAAAEVMEEAADQGALTPEAVQKMVADALAADREARETETKNVQLQTEINKTFGELGYNTERDANGRLTDFTTQQVAMLAINNHKGDIAAAHEAYNTWLADQAKAYLQKHQGDATLAPDGGDSTTAPDPGAKGLSPLEKAMARMAASEKGPEM